MERIGEYLVRRLVGEGGMGKVYEAEERLSRRRVALKVLRPELAKSEEGRRLFLNEMTILAHLDHPNVVRCLACTEADEQLVMALEYLEGKTLREYLNQHGALPWEEAVDVAVQIASALSAAHRQEPPIVHRDLKPENVLLELGDGSVPRAKVSDFGIAKGLQEKSWASTEAGLGTPLWTAPEQGRDGFVPSPRVDVWALGLIAYFVLTGKQYWRHASGRSSVVDLVLELERASLVAPSERAREAGLGERIPPGFDAWFARAVNRRAEERFADAGESWRALAPILGVAERGSSARRLAWMGVALVLLLLGVLVVVLR